jgi:hypothetical protein
LPAKAMFQESGGRWFLRAESVPGDLSIKAIGVDKSGLYIETAPLEPGRVSGAIIEEMLPFSFDADQRIFSDVHTNAKLISFSKPVKPETGLDARSLFTILLKDVSPVRRKSAVRLMDMLYTKSCFAPEETEDIVSAPVSMQQVQRLQLGLQQKLTVEQRPWLALRNKGEGTVQNELGAELRLLFTLERRLISMKPDELLDFIVEYVNKNGEERTKNILLFTIAGQIKQTMPKLTWKEARRLARQISNKMPKSA